MRSELVYSAGIKIANRFLLATVAIKAVRKLHISTTRTEDTANVVFCATWLPAAIPMYACRRFCPRLQSSP